MRKKIGPDHYRYEALLEPGGVKIIARRYVVIGETPKCWYIISDFMAHFAEMPSTFAEDQLKRYRKRVLKYQDHGRRFAMPTAAWRCTA